MDPATETSGVHPKWGWKRDPGWELGTCVWALHGVWDVDSGYVMAPDYFHNPPNDLEHEAEFLEDYWRPHIGAFCSRMRESHPEAILFIAPPVFAPPPQISDQLLKGRCCYSTHYYDGLTLITRSWHFFNADALGVLRGKYKSPIQAVKFGERAIRKSLQEQLGTLQSDAKILGDYPTIIGEIGIPYDMDGKRAYGYTDDGKYKGDYTNQQKALDASLNAADGPNGLNYTIWTYCPDNSHMWGDGWNLEDLSIWSPDDVQKKDTYRMEYAQASSAALLRRPPTVGMSFATPSTQTLASTRPSSPGHTGYEYKEGQVIASLENWENAYDFLTDGARAVKAFCRPYPRAIVGIPQDIKFDVQKASFTLKVLVRSEDALKERRGDESRPSSSSSMTINPEDDEPLATEIFVPLVHYASAEIVKRSHGIQSDDSEISSTPGSPDNTQHKRSSSLDLSTSWRSSVPSMVTDQEPLFLSVSVSDGRWAVHGQSLKWWYPVPAPGEPDKTYTITITRSGGAIKTLDKSSRTCWLWEALRRCCNIL